MSSQGLTFSQILLLLVPRISHTEVKWAFSDLKSRPLSVIFHFASVYCSRISVNVPLLFLLSSLYGYPITISATHTYTHLQTCLAFRIDHSILLSQCLHTTIAHVFSVIVLTLFAYTRIRRLDLPLHLCKPPAQNNLSVSQTILQTQRLSWQSPLQPQRF